MYFMARSPRVVVSGRPRWRLHGEVGADFGFSTSLLKIFWRIRLARRGGPLRPSDRTHDLGGEETARPPANHAGDGRERHVLRPAEAVVRSRHLPVRESPEH